MEINDEKLIITDEEGKTLEFEVLFTFDSDEFKKSYIAFTDNSTDENGNIKVYANIYDPSGEDKTLGEINSEEEWHVIENLLSSLQKRLGESDGEQ